MGQWGNEAMANVGNPLPHCPKVPSLPLSRSGAGGGTPLTP
jgi:hypothetical protein